jgi:hypothetical protein
MMDGWWSAMRQAQYGIRNTHTLSAASNTFGIRYSCQQHVTGTCILRCVLRLYGFYIIVLAPVQSARLSAASGGAPRSLPDHFWPISSPGNNTQRMRMRNQPNRVVCAHVRQNGAYLCLITDGGACDGWRWAAGHRS